MHECSPHACLRPTEAGHGTLEPLGLHLQTVEIGRVVPGT